LKAHEFIKRRGLQWADVIRLRIAAHGEHDDRAAEFGRALGWRARRKFCPHHSERLPGTQAPADS
jgi:hypothetical protein